MDTGECRPDLGVVRRYADNGHAQAIYALGVHHWRNASADDESTPDKAKTYFRRAAGRDHFYAALSLISLCDEHECRTRWIERATAIEKRRYRTVDSVRDRLARPDPPVLATELLGRWVAAVRSEEPSTDATYLIARLLETGHAPPLARDWKASIRMMSRAAEQDSVLAATYLGELLATGHRIQRDREQALDWYRRAQKHNFAPAAARAGALLLHGAGPIEARPDKGAALLREAANRQVAVAAYYLGDAYRRARGVERDLDAAVSWLERAASLGFPAARAMLGLMYYDGDGVARDDGAARQRLRRAARWNLPRAQTVLAELLVRGGGGPVNKAKAAAWVHFVLEHHSDSISASTRSWASDLHSKLAATLDAQQQRRADSFVRSRKEALTYVDARTDWCADLGGALCEY